MPTSPVIQPPRRTVTAQWDPVDVNKVDPAAASELINTRPLSGPPPGKVTHAPYRGEPYIRVTYRDGSNRDGKALAWTPAWVLFHTEKGSVHEEWVPAPAVTRIPRETSDWQDPYDAFTAP